MNFHCNCDEECFPYTNISTGEISFICNNDEYCDFKHTIKDPFYTTDIVCVQAPEKETIVIPTYFDRTLEELVEAFKVNSKVSTFQMIENKCKENGIQLFDHNSERINDFLDRILQEKK